MKYLTIDEFIRAQTEEDLWKIIEDYDDCLHEIDKICEELEAL